MSGDWCDYPQFYHEEFPVARKAHRCCECEAPIVRGEKHLRWFMKFDGAPDHGRQHMLCRELCMLMNYEGDDGCCGFGMMKEAFHENEWDRDFNKNDQPFVKGRRLLAQILRRERAAKREDPTSMSETPDKDVRPLHVQVAEAIGWRDVEATGYQTCAVGAGCHYGIAGPAAGNWKRHVLHYDTDWGATGPLVQKLRLNVFCYSDGQWECTSPDHQIGCTNAQPLVAVCAVILALKAAGKLRP